MKLKFLLTLVNATELSVRQLKTIKEHKLFDKEFTPENIDGKIGIAEIIYKAYKESYRDALAERLAEEDMDSAERQAVEHDYKLLATS